MYKDLIESNTRLLIMKLGTSNKLTGQIGEHLVAAKLGCLGFYASPYAGNVPNFDITAVNSENLKTFPVQVKTSNANTLVHSQIDKWVEHSIDENNVQSLGSPLELSHPQVIWVVVQLQNRDISNARYFICHAHQIQNEIIKRYRDFMERHDFRRPHGGGSKQEILTLKEMEKFEDNWSIFKE